MTANGNVHLTKQGDHFVGRDPEFTSHVVHAKLAQTPLLRITDDARSHELANATGKLLVDDANSCRLIPSDGGTQFRGRRAITKLTRRARSSGTTFSRLFADASRATTANSKFPFFAAMRTCSTPTTTVRALTPSPINLSIRSATTRSTRVVGAVRRWTPLRPARSNAHHHSHLRRTY